MADDVVRRCGIKQKHSGGLEGRFGYPWDDDEVMVGLRALTGIDGLAIGGLW